MIDSPIPVHAYDEDGHGAVRNGLSEAALMVMAQEVIVRLAQWAQTSETTEAPRIGPADLDVFCDALVGSDASGAKTMLMLAYRQGASHEDLCLHHIGAAALRLGERWEEDSISFRAMAVAAGRMLHLLRDLRELAPPVVPRNDRSALFAAVPGEQHVLGVTMAADLFRERQWDIDLRVGQSEEQLVETVRAGAYPIVGLSASNVERVRALTRMVVALRLALPKVFIFVGGHIAEVDEKIAMRVGADGAAHDMERCYKEMARLARMVPRHDET